MAPPSLWSRISGLLRSRTLDAELDDEVRFHLEMLIEQQIRRGVSPSEARAAALRDFGGITQMKEAHREQRGLPVIETFVQDVRYGIRTLLRTPAFTLAALLTLALGIGATTAIFSVVNAVLLRPLPYPRADELVQLMRRYSEGEAGGQTGRRYLFFRDHMQSVAPLAAYRGATGFNLANGDTAEFVRAMPVSKEYFDVFGVPPWLGGSLTAEHDAEGGPDAAVLSYALWRRLFAGDPATIGRSVLLGGRPFTVVGVMPASFRPMQPADLFVPLRPGITGPGGGFNYAVVSRLKPGVTRDQANSEAQSVWTAYKAQFPSPSTDSDSELPSQFVHLQDSATRSARPALLMMLGAVAALLLIACANTANLLLVRASGRGREIAVRAALGAARSRIVRQLLTESVVLSLFGAALGVLLAWWAVPALLSLTPSGFTIQQDVRLDANVLAATLGIAVLTGLVFGLVPALTLSRHNVVNAFKDEGTRTTAGHRAGLLRQTLVVAEVALCMVLLVVAGLLVQTFLRLRAVDPGFDSRGVLTAQMSLQGRYVERADINKFFDRGLERLRRIPGVAAAAVVNGVPIERGLNLNVDVLDGPEKIEGALTDWRYASTGYFGVMGIAIVAGRSFEERDRAGAPPIAVVNQEFARRFLKGARGAEGASALGHHIRVFKTDGDIEIVGVAKDVAEQGLKGNLPPVMYVPVTQANPAGIRASHTYFQMSWVVRASNTGPEIVRRIRDEIRALDPQQPFSGFRTMEEIKGEQIRDERFEMTLLAVFAITGLLLASAGIYGLIAYSVAQRTREFGIRMALGATSDRILRSVVGQGIVLALIGVLTGVCTAAVLTRALQGFIWGVSALDPLTFVSVSLILLGVAALASIIPALRALRLNPVAALRQ